MVKRDVSQDTVELLKECDAGCKMAIDSMEQISRHITDEKLKALVKRYNGNHIKIKEEIHRALNNVGAEGQEPNPMAKASSWFMSEMKMMIHGDSKKAASLLTDGCNMGIKSLCEYKNEYKAANEKSVDLCVKLCDIEAGMVEELQEFL